MDQTPRRKLSILWFLATAGGFAVLVAGLVAFAQAPWPDPYRLPQPMSWSWFTSPMEWNAPLRLDRIEADLHSVAVRESGKTTETWVVGDGLFLARSTNGETWTKVALPEVKPDDVLTITVRVVNPAVPEGPSKGGKAPAKGPDATQSDTPAAPGLPPHSRVLAPRNLYDITFVDAKGWVVGDAGAIAHTADGGKTWAWQASPVDVLLTSVRFREDGLTGVAVGAAGVILSTKDGGATWSRMALPPIPLLDLIGTPVPAPAYPASPAPPSGFENIPVREDEAKNQASQVDPKGGRKGSSDVPKKPMSIQEPPKPPSLDASQVLWQGLASSRGNGFTAVGMYVPPDTTLASYELVHSSPPLAFPSQLAPTSSGFVALIGPTLAYGNDLLVFPESLGLDIPDSLLSVDFWGTNVGWACGPSNLLATDDGGRSWSRLAFSKKEGRSAGIALTGRQSGFVVDVTRRPRVTRKDMSYLGLTVSMTVLGSEDGGRSWSPKGELVDWAGWSSGIDDEQPSPSGPDLDARGIMTPRVCSIAFEKGGRNGWVVGPYGFINRTTDAGKTWIPATRFLPRAWGRWVDGVFKFLPPVSNPALVPNNSPNGPPTAPAASSQGYPYYASLRLPDHVPDPDQPDRVGFDRWSRPGLAYRRLPAPWFWLVLQSYPALLIVGLVRSRPAPKEDRSEISPRLRSDRPLEPGDPDALGFDQIARGLSRFLRNENTEPPLTIAITGEWGSGKSSLMSLVQADLRGRGFRPVWFNAWHHQQEEQQLASLLATVRNEALPTWSRPLDWLWFSSRLLWRRGRKYAGLIVPLTLVFAVSLGYILQDPERLGQVAGQIGSLGDSLWKKPEPEKAKDQEATGKERDEQARLLLDQLKLIEEIIAQLDQATRPEGGAKPSSERDKLQEVRVNVQDQLRANQAERPAPAAPPAPAKPPPPSPVASDAGARGDAEGLKHPAVWALFLSGLGLAVSLWRGLTAFGLKPGTLLASMSNSVKVSDLSAQAGFRYRFGREFADVTWALRPRTLVLLIDDLDRCHPDRVMQVLEMVNFLVSSGECVVVMGMAKARVIRCIAKVFKDVAEGDPDGSKGREAEKIDGRGKTPGPMPEALLSGGFEGPDGSAAPRPGEGVKDYARNYLEKIINIEVPVPHPSPDQAHRLLVSDGDVPEGPSTAPAPSGRSRLTRALARVPALAPRIGAISLLLVAVIVGLWLGGFLAGPRPTPDPSADGVESAPEAPKAVAVRERSAAPDASPAVPAVNLEAPPATQTTAGDPSSPPADVVRLARLMFPPSSDLSPGDHARWTTAAASVFGVIALGIVFAALSWLRAPVVVVKDSPEFVQALDIWYPVIAARPYTPRALKRFLNRVRFVAARMGDPKPERSRWDELLGRIDARLARRRAETPPAPTSAEKSGTAEDPGPAVSTAPSPPKPARSRDAMVVAFCSLARFDARWLREDDAWSSLRPVDHDDAAGDPDGHATDDGVRLLHDALARHRAAFPDSWPPPDDQRSRFLEVEQPS